MRKTSGARKSELRLLIRAQNERILLWVTSTNLILLKCCLETLGRARTLQDNPTFTTEPLLRYRSPQSSMSSRCSRRAEYYGTRRSVGSDTNIVLVTCGLAFDVCSR